MIPRGSCLSRHSFLPTSVFPWRFPYLYGGDGYVGARDRAEGVAASGGSRAHGAASTSVGTASLVAEASGLRQRTVRIRARGGVRRPGWQPLTRAGEPGCAAPWARHPERTRARRGGAPVGERAAVVARAGRHIVGTAWLLCRLRRCEGTVRDGMRRFCPHPLIELLPSVLRCGFISSGGEIRGIYWQHR